MALLDLAAGLGKLHAPCISHGFVQPIPQHWMIAIFV